MRVGFRLRVRVGVRVRGRGRGRNGVRARVRVRIRVRVRVRVTSGMPYLFVATQGFSMASASSSTLGSPSLPVDGSAMTLHLSKT